MVPFTNGSIGLRRVVSAMFGHSAIEISSNPVTAIFSGTEVPFSLRNIKAPSAIASLAHTNASMFARSVHACMALNPPMTE